VTIHGSCRRFGFPLHSVAVAHEKAIAEILAEQLPDRRLRTNPRVIKRKMSGLGRQAPDHRNWPQPPGRRRTP